MKEQLYDGLVTLIHIRFSFVTLVEIQTSVVIVCSHFTL